jgi:hypothetical protein
MSEPTYEDEWRAIGKAAGGVVVAVISGIVVMAV